MLQFVARLAEEAPAPLIAPPYVISAIVAAVFVVLGLVTFSYRDVANRHAKGGRPGGASQHQDDVH